MTNASQSDRHRKKVVVTLSDEARAVLAEVPKGMKSQFVENAILAWAKVKP